MQIKTTGYLLRLVRKTIIKQKGITNTEKGVEKREPL